MNIAFLNQTSNTTLTEPQPNLNQTSTEPRPNLDQPRPNLNLTENMIF